MDKNFLKLFKDLKKDKNFIQIRQNLIDKEFNKIKKNILNEFNNHPVTREIEMGISAPNISNTLNGVTNLYSFIGFEEGSDPISPIKNLLEKSSFRITPNGENIFSTIIFDIPSAKTIFLSTPMPWATGRSWAKGIETGISGIGYYLKKTKNSRSGLGIQSQTKIRSDIRFKNTKYISDLINKFEKQLNDLNKLNI